MWDYAFNSSSTITEYVYFRDFDKSITCIWWVYAFSESGMLRELILRDAEIYDFDGNLMFKVPHAYISGRPEGMHIEFPFRPEGNG